MIRLDKYISDTSGLTRSQAGKAIRSGKVSVNGSVICRPEQKISEDTDRISLNGEACSYQRFRYFLLDKPTGLITASRDRSQKTVLDLFPQEIRNQGIFPVGRLDKDTSGLLLLTNDGVFAHRVISPRSGIEKVYRAETEYPVTEEDSVFFRCGLTLADGTKCLPAVLRPLEGHECLVTVREGKYHQVRRMLAAVGKPVLALRRLSVGPLQIDPEMECGTFRELTDTELCMMFNILNMEK